MNKQLSASLLVLSCAFSASAIASDESKTYFTAGVSHINVDLGFSASGITTDETDTAPHFTIGYKVDDNFALEGGLIGPAEASITASGSASGTLNGKSLSVSGAATITAEADTTYTIGGVYNMSPNDQLSIYAKGGMLWWDVDYVAALSGNVTYDGTTTSVSTSSTIASRDGSDAYYGIGAAYDLSNDLELRADYTKTEIDSGDIDIVGLSLVSNF